MLTDRPSTAATFVPARVLLVDDSEPDLENLESILSALGEPLVRARSAQEALGTLYQGDFALALLDVRMPDMDGFEVARVIRGRPLLRSLPIIFITALDPSKEDLERAYALGAVDFITKPLIPSALLSKARVFVDLYKREREARRNESRFESISELSPVGIFQTDARGDCLWVNERWSEIAGLSPAQALGEGWSKAIHPDDRERVFAEWYRAAQRGLVFRSEYRFLRPDGVVTWVLGQAKAEHDSAGRVLGYVGTITDITERKVAEGKLARVVDERTEELGAIMDSVPAAIWITKDPQGKVIVGNRRSYELLGMTPGENVSKSSPQGEAAIPYDIYIDGRRARPDELPIQRAAATGEPVIGHEQEIRGPRGRSRWIYGNTVPLKDEKGKVSQVVAAFVDVTDRKEAERDRKRLAALVESSEDAIITLDLGGTVTSWNRGAEHLFGYQAVDMLGRPVTMLIPDELREEEQGLLKRIRENNRGEHYETRRRHRDGRALDVSVSISPIRDERGEVIAVSKILRDISERKRAEEEIRCLNADLERKVAERTRELQEAFEELNAFSGMAAHDLRAPLRTISNFSSALIQDYSSELDETAQMYARRISASCGRMATLIDALLAYSRLRTSEIVLEAIDLGVLAAEVVTQVVEDILDRKVKINIKKPLPVVMGHRVMLTQVLTNLLSNSIKFVAPGTEPTIEIAVEHGGAMARLGVRDNGIGIAEGHLGRLFRPFARLPGSEDYPGVGLGLAIVKRAVERMGGRMGADSTLGRGSTFWIELPKARVD